ncbi:DUF2804 domain-containing protein [Undibacterium terreum]|uniref:DUF2804 domain-containing protein n=1 Tax=Undibacterium terreum TaxID=1224302 RepID=A0A916UEB3_9BURK|nr:DUF2804 domain-containing protein [Undibacterium terreum]GGC69199.1 hypothetical protein GCM10011396_15260 [Undibacterium terreum]
MISSNQLMTAPASLLDARGQPQFGKFSGQIAQCDWTGLSAPYQRSGPWRYFHHKRWQYVALATEELFCGIAIVDLGWINTAFAYAFDRKQGKEVGSFSQDGLPGLTANVGDRPAAGAASSFRFLANSIDYRHMAGTDVYRLQLRCGAFEIDAELDAGSAAPFLLALGPIAGGAAHATQKSSGMPMRGVVKASGKSYMLDSGVASFDYSNGFLARETSWRWASAHALDMGFNLQAGYFGTQENVLWLDGNLISLGQASFQFDASNPMSPWHIRTDDGLLDLHFQPEGFRRENKDLLIAASRYLQPVGSFNGWVKASHDAEPRLVRDLVGVTEDHFSRW